MQPLKRFDFSDLVYIFSNLLTPRIWLENYNARKRDVACIVVKMQFEWE